MRRLDIFRICTGLLTILFTTIAKFAPEEVSYIVITFAYLLSGFSLIAGALSQNDSKILANTLITVSVLSCGALLYITNM